MPTMFATTSPTPDHNPKSLRGAAPSTARQHSRVGFRRMTFLAALCLVACGGGTTVSAASYPQACELDGDCAAVFQGDVCTPCGCPNAGILSTALSQYTADVAAMKMQCGPMPAVACKPCTPVRGLCINKACATRPE